MQLFGYNLLLFGLSLKSLGGYGSRVRLGMAYLLMLIRQKPAKKRKRMVPFESAGPIVRGIIPPFSGVLLSPRAILKAVHMGSKHKWTIAQTSPTATCGWNGVNFGPKGTPTRCPLWLGATQPHRLPRHTSEKATNKPSRVTAKIGLAPTGHTGRARLARGHGLRILNALVD